MAFILMNSRRTEQIWLHVYKEVPSRREGVAS